ncbi:MAG: esterase family protein [Ignavibacteriaceae bacterium]|nr:esterase family protein [Ignavibacteriaceae bacterium]
MKSFTSATFRFLLVICISTILTGCEEDEHFRYISSSTPSREKIVKSAFYRFTETLREMDESERENAVKEFLIKNPNSPIIEGGGIACIYWYGNADTVLVIGDIQGSWNFPDTMNFIRCGSGNFFFRIYMLPSDLRADYLLIVDGKSMTDPRNPVVAPSVYGPHSQISLPGFIPDKVRDFRNEIPRGTIDSLVINSNYKELNSRLAVIYKPHGYDTLEALPVVFVNDGLKAIEYSSYLNVLDNLICEKRIRPVLAVFMEYKEGDQNYNLNEYEAYITAFCDELVPLIERIYKTTGNSSDRIITGVSAGGHLSLLTVLKRPDVFLNSAGQSTTTTRALFETIEKPHKFKRDLKIYLDVARYDLVYGAADSETFLFSNQKLSKSLAESGIRHQLRIFNDGHQWGNWRERTDDILIYFLSTNHPHP